MAVSTLIDVHHALENHKNLTVDTVIIHVKEVYNLKILGGTYFLLLHIILPQK